MLNINKKNREELIYVLVNDYLYQKEHNRVFGRENSSQLYITTGKLSGACMALGLSLEETANEIRVVTTIRRKLIYKTSIITGLGSK